ncbi:TetR/AcrR family transcriptional regulator [Raoultibacter phocaeensis]|uniref:TetR/AcrR family transcriptional regulator n=1 Tax=Raoultibacter phocaeensis TaxID=2479841 RepID=UPI0015D5FB5E|nr:helix-turn-helix domain-containing protein [Raoultibacter phocaeensis]
MTNLQPLDARVSRTRHALFGAIDALLEERDFDSITVKQICQRASVSKAAFYQHFDDKYDLVVAWLSAELKPSAHLFTDQNLTVFFNNLLDAMNQHKTQLEHIMRQPGGNEELQGKVVDIWLKGFRSYYSDNLPISRQAEINREMSVIYNCYGAISLAWWFVKTQPAISQDELVGHLVSKMQHDRSLFEQGVH